MTPTTTKKKKKHHHRWITEDSCWNCGAYTAWCERCKKVAEFDKSGKKVIVY